MAPPDSWTWSRAAPSRSSKPGWPPSPIRGASASRSSRWMDSPGSRALSPKNSPAQGQSWTPSTLYTSPATHWMSAEGAPGKNSTTGTGAPRTPSTRPAGCLHTRSCLLTLGQQYQILDLFSSDEHVALEVTWSAYQNIIDAYRAPNTSAGNALMRAEINTLTSTRVPRSLTELTTLGRTLKRRATDILALLRPPPHHRRPHRSHQRPPRTPTRIRTRTCETSPTTSPEHSSKPEDSDPNYTPNYEEPDCYLLKLQTI